MGIFGPGSREVEIPSWGQQNGERREVGNPPEQPEIRGDLVRRCERDGMTKIPVADEASSVLAPRSYKKRTMSGAFRVSRNPVRRCRSSDRRRITGLKSDSGMVRPSPRQSPRDMRRQLASRSHEVPSQCEGSAPAWSWPRSRRTRADVILFLMSSGRA